MNKFLIALFISVIAIEAMAINAYSIREIRDPVKMKARLDADFATVAAGVGVAAVTNATLTQSKAAITLANAGVVITNWTTVYTTNEWIYLDASTNAATNVVITAVNTPQTAAVTVVNGGAVVTNTTITLQTN